MLLQAGLDWARLVERDVPASDVQTFHFQPHPYGNYFEKAPPWKMVGGHKTPPKLDVGQPTAK